MCDMLASMIVFVIHLSYNIFQEVTSVTFLGIREGSVYEEDYLLF